MNRLLELEKELARFSGKGSPLGTPSVPVSNGQSRDAYVRQKSDKTNDITEKGKICCLSIDGGGIRGLIPALILAEIETRVKRLKPNWAIQDCFDYYAGTSTGGIVAASLLIEGTPESDFLTGGAPDGKSDKYKYSPAAIAKIYDGPDAAKIFNPYFNNKGVVASKHKVKYDRTGLDNVLKERIGKVTFGQLLKPIFITSVNINLGRPRIWDNVSDKDQPAIDVLRATSAAQTYFDPVPIHGKSITDMAEYADGGTVQNNPAWILLNNVMCNFNLLERQFGGVISNKAPRTTSYDRGLIEKGYVVNPEDVVMVSIGTGESHVGVRPGTYYDAGEIGWAGTIIEQGMAANSALTHLEVHRMLGRKNYFRFNPSLLEAVELDDISPANIKRMKDAVNRLIRDENARIDELVALLIANN